MPYIYRGPRSASAPSGGSSSRISPRPGLRFGTSSRGLPRVPIAPLSQQGSRQVNRTAPERFDMDLVEQTGRLVTAPAAIAERPIGIINTLGRAITGTPPDEQGPIDWALERIGDLGIKGTPFSVGGVVGIGEEALNRIGSFVPAIANAGDMMTLARYAGRGDDFVLPDQVGKKKNGLPIFNWFGQNMTVGDLKAELDRRGFNNEVLEDGSVVKVPWERVLAKMQGDSLGAFQFGDKLVNDSVITDMAFRFASDPLNLAMGAGAVGKLGSLASWASRSRVAGLAGRAVRPIEWGNGYARDMVNLGVRAEKLSAPSVAATELAQGVSKGATLKGLATFFGRTARGVVLPGTGSLALRYYRGAQRLQLAGLGVEFGSGALAEASKNTLGEDAITTGFMNGLHDFAQSVMNDRPLSENSLFVMAAAFHNPALPLLGENIRAVKGGIRSAAGDEGLRLFADRYDFTTPAPKSRRARARSAVDPLSALREGRAREDALLLRLGNGDREAGRIELSRIYDHIDLQIAFDKIHANIKRHFESFDDFVFRGESLRPMLRAMVDEMRQSGELNARVRLQKFDEWAKDTYTIEGYDAEGRTIRTKNPVEFDASPAAVVDQWLQYSSALKTIAPQLEELGNVVLGRAKILSQESIDGLIAAVRAMSKDGKTPRSVVEAMLLRAPALLDDPRVNGDYWARQGITSAGNGQYIGGRVMGGAGSSAVLKRRSGDEGFNTAELVTELERIREIAPPEADLFHEARKLEAEAPGGESLNVDGPLVQGGLRQVHSVAQLRRIRERSAGNFRALSKQERALVSAFNRKWTKNGRPRGTGPKPMAAIAMSTVRRRADDIVAYTRENGGATFDPITGTFHEVGGYGVGRVTDTFRKVDPNDADALRRAFEDVVREYPDAKVGTWLDDNGTLHVDPSDVIDSLDEAVNLAVERNQQAVWDFSAQREISSSQYAEYASPGVIMRQEIHTKLKEAFNLSDQEASDVAVVVDARAKAWASEMAGRTPHEWYRRITALEKGTEPTFGAPHQTATSAILDRLDAAPSVPRGYEPTWGSERGGLKYRGAPESAQPGSTHVSRYEVPGAGPALSVVAYGSDGAPVGALTVLVSGTREAPQRGQVGAFKIVVDPAVQRQGIGLRLLDAANENGFDVAANVGNNAYTPSGRALVRRWLEQRQEAGGARSEFYDAYKDSTLRDQRQAMRVANDARTSYADMSAPNISDKYRTDIPSDADVAARVAALDQILFGKVIDRGEGVGIRALIEQPEPALLAEHGLGGSSPMEWSDINGRSVGIPGGVAGLSDGTFTLWDLWRLKAQALDPNLLPPEIRVPLYAKLFRSQVRGFSDPIDTFNRITFSVLSPRNPLLRNEALQALLRAQDGAGITRLAEIADSGLSPTEIGKRMKEEFGLKAAGSGLTNTQLSAVAMNAKRFMENPDWFTIREGENVLQYSERVAAVMYGSQMKVGTFGMMLGDPAGFSRGTIDSHMVRRLVEQGYVKAEDVVALKNPKGDGYRNADGQEIMYRRANGEINPAVPEHLRDLPWDPPGNKVTIYGQTYELLNEALRRKMVDEGITDFDLGGYQWMEWDMQRKRVEPHTLAYPGAYKLPHMKPAELKAALKTATEAGYFGKYRNDDFAMKPYSPQEGVFYQAEARSGVAGETVWTRVGNDVEFAIRGFESANLDTALHEFAHVWRHDIDLQTLQSIESHFGVKDGKWTEALDESFANTMVRYFREGKAPTPEMAGVFERFRDWLLAFYQAFKEGGFRRKGRERAITPELQRDLDSLFQAREGFQEKAAKLADKSEQELIDLYENAPEYNDRVAASIALGELRKKAAQESEWRDARAADMAEIQGVRDRMKQEAKLVRELDLRAEEIRTIKPDPSLRNGKVPEDQQRLLKETISQVREQYPQYDLEAAPLLTVRAEMDDGLLAGMFKERSVVAQLLFDYGPLGRMTSLWHWLTDPVSSSKQAHDARQMVYNKALPLGVETHTVQAILSDLRKQATIMSVGTLEVPLLRGITSLPANAINRIAKDIITLNKDGTFNDKGVAAWRRIEAKYGRNGFHHLLDEASNGFIRRVDTKRLKGQKVGALEDALREGYRLWQHAPVIGSTSRFASKTMYHMFRFVMDVRWHLLNKIEADSLALMRDGAKATRFGPKPMEQSPEALFYHAGKSELSLPSIFRAADDQIQPVLRSAEAKAGAARALEADPFRDDSALYLFNRNLVPVVERAFEIRRLGSVDDVLNRLPYDHPTIRLLVDKFGGDRSTWAKQIDEMLYGFDRKGAKETVAEAVRRVRDEDGWSQIEYDSMVPLLQELTNKNQRLFDDIIKLYQGNPDRGRLERIMNSFWLYWPISYQIKATKWLLDVTMNRAFGQQTNFGGVWTLDRAADAFKARLRDNPEFQQQMQDNEDAWFIASMLFPISPTDIGVSLNKGVRYVGSWLGFFPEYTGVEDPGDLTQKMLEMGPIYTAKLLNNGWDLFQQALPSSGDADKSTLQQLLDNTGNR